jgi:Prophage CP4-57 regulatory protein (AlpA)
MSQAELSQKALALKAASKPAAFPADTDETEKNQEVLTPKVSASPASPRAPPEVRTILRMPQVETATGLKTSHIYDLIAQGRFPARREAVEPSSWLVR